MIELIFTFGGDIVLVKVEGTKVTFGNTAYGAQMSSIKGLQLSEQGVYKEHPDLKGKDNWREEAVNRFQEHIRKLKTEKLIAKYVMEELKQHGYVPKKWKQNGYRTEKL